MFVCFSFKWGKGMGKEWKRGEGRLDSGDRSGGRERERGRDRETGREEERQRQGELEREQERRANACLHVQRSSRKEREGERVELVSKGEHIACAHGSCTQPM